MVPCVKIEEFYTNVLVDSRQLASRQLQPSTTASSNPYFHCSLKTDFVPQPTDKLQSAQMRRVS